MKTYESKDVTGTLVRRLDKALEALKKDDIFEAKYQIRVLKLHLNSPGFRCLTPMYAILSEEMQDYIDEATEKGSIDRVSFQTDNICGG